MNVEIIVLSIAVALDAFAISICKGITIKRHMLKKALVIALWFGFFQGLMPLLGFYFMDNVGVYIENIKRYVIFFLLTYIGCTMIIEAKKSDELNDSIKFKEMLLLSIATSLDAFSVGMTISLLKINVLISVSVIAIVTFLFSYLGVKIGNKFGDKYKIKAQTIGGLTLIIIAIKILLEQFI